MSSFVLKDAQIRFNELDITSIMNQMTLNYGAELQDSTTFGAVARRRRSGLIDVSMNYRGFWDDPPDLSLFNSIGNDTPKVISVAGLGEIEGTRTYSFTAKKSEYSPGGAVGEMYALNMTAMGDSPLSRGRLFGFGAKTVSGMSSPLLLGAAASGKTLYGALHVVDNEGTGDQTLNVIVESSATETFDSTAVTRLTFDQVVNANEAQWKTLAGPLTDTWYRATWTIAGSGSPSFTIFLTVGIGN